MSRARTKDANPNPYSLESQIRTDEKLGVVVIILALIVAVLAVGAYIVKYGL